MSVYLYFSLFGLAEKYTEITILACGDQVGVWRVRLPTLTGKRWPGAATLLLFCVHVLKIEFQSVPLSGPRPPLTQYLTQYLSIVLCVSLAVTVLFLFCVLSFLS